MSVFLSSSLSPGFLLALIFSSSLAVDRQILLSVLQSVCGSASTEAPAHGGALATSLPILIEIPCYPVLQSFVTAPVPRPQPIALQLPQVNGSFDVLPHTLSVVYNQGEAMTEPNRTEPNRTGTVKPCCVEPCSRPLALNAVVLLSGICHLPTMQCALACG